MDIPIFSWNQGHDERFTFFLISFTLRVHDTYSWFLNHSNARSPPAFMTTTPRRCQEAWAIVRVPRCVIGHIISVRGSSAPPRRDKSWPDTTQPTNLPHSDRYHQIHWNQNASAKLAPMLCCLSTLMSCSYRRAWGHKHISRFTAIF